MEASFENRERQFEAKFAHDQEIDFKAQALRNKLFAFWAADQMGEGALPDYADALLEFAFGREAQELIERVMADLRDSGVAVADAKVRRALELCADRARSEVLQR